MKKLLFCNLNLILEENNWQDETVFFYDDDLKERFKSCHLKSGPLNDATYLISKCENLIADDGSILICSNQIAEKKLSEFPDHFIIFCTTSQIVTNIGEGLRSIKNKSTKGLILSSLCS